MQAHEKVEKSQNTVCFQWIVAPVRWGIANYWRVDPRQVGH